MSRRRSKSKRTHHHEFHNTTQIVSDFEKDYMSVDEINIKRITPKSENQETMYNYLRQGKPVVFGIGVAGTGKSMIAAAYGAELLKAKKINKIYLIRPNVLCGRSLGLLPGDVDEKLKPFFLQTLTHLSNFLSPSFVDYLLKKRIIEMLPVEYMRGMSLENAYVIAEESQNFEDSEFEMLLTRIGNNCQICFTGDQKQSDIKNKSGLLNTLELLSTKYHTEILTEELEKLQRMIGYVQFTFEDVQRSALVKTLTKLYFYN